MWLYGISNGSAGSEHPDAALAQVRAAAAEGLDFFQIREKTMSARMLFALAMEARAALDKAASGCRLIINDRLDIAIAAGADGVHLPAAGLDVASARLLAPGGFLVGLSCHSVAEVATTAAAGASFCVLGPIFATPGKSAATPLGLDALGEATEFGIPVLALGGVSEANAMECLRRGAAGLAGIRLFQSPGVGARLRGLDAALS